MKDKKSQTEKQPV